MKVMLLLLVLFNFSFPTSFATLTNNLDPGNQLEKLRDKQKEESNGSITSGGSGIVSERKFAHASGRGGGGGNGGRSVGEGSNQIEGHSNASPRGGGGAVIPVYADGGVGARKRNNSHTPASNSSLCGKDGLLLIVVATVLTSLLLHIFE